MNIMRGFKKITILFLAVFLSSCSSPSTISSSEESINSSIIDSSTTPSSESSFYDEGASLLLYQELEKAEQLSLSKDCLGFDLVTEERIGPQYSSSNLTFELFYDEYDNPVVSYRDNSDINHDYVYYDVDGWEYVYCSEIYERIVSSHELANVIIASADDSSLVSDIEVTLDQIKLSINKAAKDGVDIYTITVYEFDALFHQITDNAFLDADIELTLPTTIEMTSGVKDGLIVFEECAFNFSVDNKKCKESIRVDYYYPENLTLPRLVSERILNNKTKDEGQETIDDNIVKIIPNTKEKKLSSKESIPDSDLVQYYEPKYLNQNKSTDFYCDGSQYIFLYNKGNRFIEIYDINTLNKVYDVVFIEPVSIADARYGKLMIYFPFTNDPNLKNKYFIYSLEDFSLLFVADYHNKIIYKDYFFYQCYEENEYRVKMYNFVTKEDVCIYHHSEYAVFYFYLDKDVDVFFFWHNIINSSDIHYCGYSLQTNQLLYDKITSEITGNSADASWKDHGLSFKGYDKKIDGLTGEIVDYFEPTRNYPLPDTYSDYKVGVYYLNEKFVYMSLVKRHYTDPNDYETVDSQYWVYDVENESLYAEVAFNSFYRYWIIDNRIIIAYDYNEKALLKIVVQ